MNLERFPLYEYPSDTVIKFAFVSRIMKEKGIEQYLYAAQAIRKKHPNTEFHVYGFCESEYDGPLQNHVDNGTVIYHGMIRNVAEAMSYAHCIVHPTYYPEGISNVLLEACACGRPIITTDRSGCREVVDNGINGYMIPCKDGDRLVDAMEKFLSLTYEEKRQMGINARKKVESCFDRRLVVDAYVSELH